MSKKYFEADLVKNIINMAKQRAIVQDDVDYIEQMLDGKEIPLVTKMYVNGSMHGILDKCPECGASIIRSTK